MVFIYFFKLGEFLKGQQSDGNQLVTSQPITTLLLSCAVTVHPLNE